VCGLYRLRRVWRLVRPRRIQCHPTERHKSRCSVLRSHSQSRSVLVSGSFDSRAVVGRPPSLCSRSKALRLLPVLVRAIKRAPVLFIPAGSIGSWQERPSNRTGTRAGTCRWVFSASFTVNKKARGKTLQKMVTDLPFAWLDALNSFGTRLLAQSAVRSSRSPSIVSPLKPAVSTPSSAPHSSVSDAQSPVVEDVSTDPASLPLHRRWLLMSGSTAAVKDAASTPTRSSASSVSVDSPIAAVPRGGSSIFLSASLTSAALKTASTLTVSEEDLDRISQEALRRWVVA
jgi:hypothetical protein